MISQLVGDVVEVSVTSLVINVGGVGFQVLCTPSTTAGCRVGETARLHTHLAVREDALTLYGFSSADERQAFLLAQSVTGIGPKLALSIVAHLSAGQLRHAILTDNLVTLSKVPGVGRKTAQRLVLELKDKALTLETSTDEVTDHAQKEQVTLGLIGLGYSSKDAEAAWESIQEQAVDPSVTVSSLMRAALQSLAKG